MYAKVALQVVSAVLAGVALVRSLRNIREDGSNAAALENATPLDSLQKDSYIIVDLVHHWVRLSCA